MNTATLHGLVNMTNEEYHAGPGVSNSHLKSVARSPLHYWDKYINPNKEPETKTSALTLGQAFHTAILEPDLFTAQFAAAPECDRRTKEGKKVFADFEAENLGKQILTADAYQNFLNMRDAVYANASAVSMLSAGNNEQSYFVTDELTGELIKCRPDKLREDHSLIIDLKSAEDASPQWFGCAAANYGYHRAAPWYADILEVLTGDAHSFAFLVVESSRPYAVMIYYVTPEQMSFGRAENRRLLNMIAECRARGLDRDSWPSYANAPVSLELPNYIMRKSEQGVDE